MERADVEEVGGWDVRFVGWGEEDLELAYRLHLRGTRFIYPSRKHGAGYHLDHSVDWDTNVASLRRNLAYFVHKYPASWSGRRGVLRMFLEENELPPISALTDGALS
jgi:GT2 family glycosyltransferase